MLQIKYVEYYIRVGRDTCSQDAFLVTHLFIYLLFVCLSFCWLLCMIATDRMFVKFLPEIYLWTKEVHINFFGLSREHRPLSRSDNT